MLSIIVLVVLALQTALLLHILRVQDRYIAKLRNHTRLVDERLQLMEHATHVRDRDDTESIGVAS
jgi:hypothetical protein